MDFLDISIHFLNFVAPALVLALLMPLTGRLMRRHQRGSPSWWVQVAINAIVGVITLALGFWLMGRDGKMTAYGALVLAMASSQWLLLRAWR